MYFCFLTLFMNIIHNIFTFLVALVGFIGGLIWGYNSNWEYEPSILVVISFLEILAYLLIPKKQEEQSNLSRTSSNNSLTQNVNVNINNSKAELFENSDMVHENQENKDQENREQRIESKKNKVGILFIDDDKNFNVVKILKDSGWKNTKSITDVKSLDINQIKTSEIIFVDINGVGKILNLENEGLDLALMLKQKYSSEKKIIIYSANKTNNPFHLAWDAADAKLEKNALPYQFLNLVENYSLDYYN